MTDRKRISAVTVLEAMGYNFDGSRWYLPGGFLPVDLPVASEDVPDLDGDEILALLHRRADALDGGDEDSPEGTERKAVVNAIEAYERVRWPDGKVLGGKG
jgi:hypothetical protein